MTNYPDHTRIAQTLLEQQGDINRLTAELAEMRGNYEGACKTVADMHAAATGRRGLGPVRGVVEDVEDVRLRAERAEAELKRYTEADSADAAAGSYAHRAERAEAEVKQWLAFIERGMDTHMQFSVIKPDGAIEELPCADWCYACRIERAEAAIERVRAIKKSPKRSPWNTYTNAQDDGWDQALDAVLAALDEHKEPCGAASKAPNAIGNERCTLLAGHDGRHRDGILTWPVAAPGAAPANEKYRFATTWAEYAEGKRAALDEPTQDQS